MMQVLKGHEDQHHQETFYNNDEEVDVEEIELKDASHSNPQPQQTHKQISFLLKNSSQIIMRSSSTSLNAVSGTQQDLKPKLQLYPLRSLIQSSSRANSLETGLEADSKLGIVEGSESKKSGAEDTQGSPFDLDGFEAKLNAGDGRKSSSFGEHQQEPFMTQASSKPSSRKSSLSSVKSQDEGWTGRLRRSLGALRDSSSLSHLPPLPILSLTQPNSQDRSEKERESSENLSTVTGPSFGTTYQTEAKDVITDLHIHPSMSGTGTSKVSFFDKVSVINSAGPSRRASLVGMIPPPGVSLGGDSSQMVPQQQQQIRSAAPSRRSSISVVPVTPTEKSGISGGLYSRRSSLTPSWHGRPRRGSIGSQGSQSSCAQIQGVDREVVLSAYDFSQQPAHPMPVTSEYYDYIKLSQRIASVSFIHKLDSNEILWTQKEKKIKMIGRFLVGDQIGKGSFGKVKEGICSETLARVAIKIISKKRAKRIPHGMESVVREIKMLRKFKHENVVTLIDVYCKVEDSQGSTGIFPWFEAIEDEPITWIYEDGSSKSQKLMKALNYLHAQSVIHSESVLFSDHTTWTDRDVKPGNMLVTAGKVLNISDFGVAEQFDIYSNTPMKTSTFAGTHQFLAPEVTSGKDDYDGEKVDVWAAGVTLFNMLTGKYPFECSEDGNILELYEKISTCNLQLPSELDLPIQGLLKGMLAKDPAERLSVVDILAHPWTQTNYSKKHPHSQKGTISSNTSSASRLSSLSELQRAQPNSTKSVLMFKETSMLYYLDQLFGEEIQKELEEKGSYDFEDRNNGKLGEKKEEGRSKGSLGRRRSSFFQKIFPKKG